MVMFPGLYVEFVVVVVIAGSPSNPRQSPGVLPGIITHSENVAACTFTIGLKIPTTINKSSMNKYGIIFLIFLDIWY